MSGYIITGAVLVGLENLKRKEGMRREDVL
jgi:hypothetical protein